MGWTSFQDRADLTPAQILIRELNGTNENGANWTIVDHATKFGEFYGVCRFTAPGNDPVFYGIVCLFSRSTTFVLFGRTLTGHLAYKWLESVVVHNDARTVL